MVCRSVFPGLDRREKEQQENFFEYDDLDALPKEELQPIYVSSLDFPKEMIPNTKPEDVELITTLNDDIGIDEGYPLEQISEKNLADSPDILKKIRIQQ